MNYSEKYLKYKKKYLELKKSVQIGGVGFEDWINKPIYYKRSSIEMFIQKNDKTGIKINEGSHIKFSGLLYSDDKIKNSIGKIDITYTLVTLHKPDVTFTTDFLFIKSILVFNDNPTKKIYYNVKVEVPSFFYVENNILKPYKLNTVLNNSYDLKTNQDEPKKLKYEIDTNNKSYDGILTLTN